MSDKAKWQKADKELKEIPRVHDIPLKNLLELGLWCLYVSQYVFQKEYLNYEDIEEILDGYFNMPVRTTKLRKALAGASGKKVSYSKTGLGIKISHHGELHLKNLRKDGLLTVVCVDPNQPREAQKNLQEFVKSIPKGELQICDPYYGMNSLDVLEEFAKHHKTIKFLTREIGARQNKSALATAVNQFKKQYGSKVEIRSTTAKDFHDRYILAADRFLIIGHGLLDLGNKESLIILISDRFGKDIRKVLVGNFAARWSAATNL